MGQPYREEKMENNNDPFAPIPLTRDEREKASQDYENQKTSSDNDVDLDSDHLRYGYAAANSYAEERSSNWQNSHEREWLHRNDESSSSDMNTSGAQYAGTFATPHGVTPPQQQGGSSFLPPPNPLYSRSADQFYRQQHGSADSGAHYHTINNISPPLPSPIYRSPVQHYSYFSPHFHTRTHYNSTPLEAYPRSLSQPISPSFSHSPQSSYSLPYSSSHEEETHHPASSSRLRPPPFSPVQPVAYGRQPYVFVPQYFFVPADSPYLRNSVESGEVSSAAVRIPQRRKSATHESATSDLQHRTSATDSSNVLAADPMTSNALVPGVGASDGHAKVNKELVLEEDRYLITDYNYFMMKQLRLCQLTETDKKIRGGKRENIELGFPGLQCAHCTEAPNPRKFYWRSVDRLSNSFVEIPLHVLQCKYCPQEAKDALLRLKQKHHEQMTQLPRGAQKIFFRRIWRRMHSDFKSRTPSSAASPTPSEEGVVDSEEEKKPSKEVKEKSAADSEDKCAKATSEILTKNHAEGGADSVATRPPPADRDVANSMLDQTAQQAAESLAKLSKLTSAASGHSHSRRQRILLAIPEDMEWLSDMDCFIRQQIEVFCATREDIERANRESHSSVPNEGQIGVRCVHCALLCGSNKENKGKSADSDLRRDAGDASVTTINSNCSAFAYPRSIRGIYQAVRDIQRTHLSTCEHLPKKSKERLLDLNGCASLSSFLRKYYVFAAAALGLKNTQKGIRATGKSVPLGSQPAISFSERSLQLSNELEGENRKRKAQFSSTSNPKKTKK